MEYYQYGILFITMFGLSMLKDYIEVSYEYKKIKKKN